MDDTEVVYGQIFRVGYSADAIEHVYMLRADSKRLSNVLQGHSKQLPHLNHVVKTFLSLLEAGNRLLGETVTSRDENPTLPLKKPVFNDGEDITQLRGAPNVSIKMYQEPEEDVSEQNGLYNGSLRLDSATDIDTKPLQRKPLVSVASMVADFEVASNITLVLLVWIQTVERANAELHTSTNSLGSAPELDSVELLFSEKDARQHMNNLLQNFKSLLTIAASKLKDDTFDDKCCLIASKNMLLFVVSLQRLTISSMVFYEGSKNPVVLSVLHTLYEVNLSSVVHDFLANTAVKSEDDTYKNAAVQLSYEAHSILFLTEGILTTLPGPFLPIDAYSTQPDISSSEQPSNVYASYIKVLSFDEPTFMEFFLPRISPILARMYAAFYNQAPDLYVEQVKSTSFVAWVTANTIGGSPYVALDVNETTNLHKNLKAFALVDHEPSPFLNEIAKIIHPTGQSINYLPLLRVSLWMAAYSFNDSFLWHLTTAQNSKLLDLWLCTASYVLRNTHDLRHLRAVSTLLVTILLKITSPNVGSYRNSTYQKIVTKLKSYIIDEFKYKLCHQSTPIIPVSLDELGSKSALYYIMDICQVFFRANLTRKLNVEIFKGCSTILLQALEELDSEPEQGPSTYAWVELYKTLTGFLAFIRTQKILKHSDLPQLSSLVEEVFYIINVLLGPKFSGIVHDSIPVVYELLYQIMGNAEDLTALLADLALSDKSHLSTLCALLEQLNQFVKSEDSEFDYRILVESGKLKTMLATSVKSSGTKSYSYKDTFVYYGSTIDFQFDKNILKIDQMALDEK